MKSERLRNALNSILDLDFEPYTIWNGLPTRLSSQLGQLSPSTQPGFAMKESFIKKWYYVDPSDLAQLAATLRNVGYFGIAEKLENEIVNCASSISTQAEEVEIEHAVRSLISNLRDQIRLSNAWDISLSIRLEQIKQKLHQHVCHLTNLIGKLQ